MRRFSLQLKQPLSGPGRRAGLLGLLLLASLGAAAGPAERRPEPGAGQASEYAVKAAFLYNFAKFVEWPPASLLSSNAPLRLGIVGSDPFGAQLDELVKGMEKNHHPLEVRRFSSGQQPQGCQLVFISRSEQERLSPLLKSLASQPVLTVGETELFCQQGGIIRLVLVEGTVRFEINPQAAKQAGLKLSSRLLGLARIVSPGPGASPEARP